MSTRKKIEKILRSKGLNAEMEYERNGPDEWSYWYVRLDAESLRKVKKVEDEPAFDGEFIFCEIEEGVEKANELPDCSGVSL